MLKEGLNYYLKTAAQYASCQECIQKFLKEKPLIVEIIPQNLLHIHPVGYVHKFDDCFGIRPQQAFCGTPVPAAYCCKLLAFPKQLMLVKFARELHKKYPQFFQNTYLTAKDLENEEINSLLVLTALNQD